MTKPGPIQIRNAEVVENIRELSRLRGTGLTETVEAVVRESLDRERAALTQRDVDRSAEIEAVLLRFRARPFTGAMLTDEDFYDESGLPR